MLQPGDTFFLVWTKGGFNDTCRDRFDGFRLLTCTKTASDNPLCGRRGPQFKSTIDVFVCTWMPVVVVAFFETKDGRQILKSGRLCPRHSELANGSIRVQRPIRIV